MLLALMLFLAILCRPDNPADPASLDLWRTLPTTPTESARTEARMIRRQYHDAQRRHPKKPPMQLTEALRQHQFMLAVENRTEKTRDQYAVIINRYIEYLKGQDVPLTVTSLTVDHGRGFLLWVREQTSVNTITGGTRTHGPRTVQAHAQALKTFARFCAQEGIVPEDPLRNLRLPKAPTPEIATFTPSHIKRLLDAIDERPQPERNRALVYFLLATGVRASELCAISLSEADLKEGRTTVWGKGGKQRYVYFDKETAKWVVRYLGVRPDSEHQQTFLSRTGAPMNRNSLRQLFEKLGRATGVSRDVRCSPHTFRHTAATAFLKAHPGALFHLQQMLGHKDLEMCRRYAKIVTGDERLAGPGIIETLGLARRSH